MNTSKLILPLFFIFGLTGCQTLQAYDCALGGCAAVNAQKRDVLNKEQQRNAQLETQYTQAKQRQSNTRSELNSVQQDYQNLSNTITRLQEDLRRAGKENSTAAAELENLQRDIELRRGMASSSTNAIQQEELTALRKREAGLKEQVKILLSN